MLDSFDTAIWRALAMDGSLTNAELAERVHLSPSQCSRRRGALEKTGIIKGYRAIVDAEKLGFHVEAWTRVTLQSHGGTRAEDFARAIAAMDEIVEAFVITGDADYLVRIRVTTLDALADFFEQRLLALDAVAQVKSDVVLRRLKDGGGVQPG